MSFGMVEMVLVLVVVLMLFGVGKLPQVMGDLAKGVRNFRDGLKDGPEAEGAATTGRPVDLPLLEHRPEERDGLVR